MSVQLLQPSTKAAIQLRQKSILPITTGRIRLGEPKDVAEIAALINHYAALGQMLEENRPKLLAMLTRRLGPAADFLNPDELLKPDMNATVSFLSPRKAPTTQSASAAAGE